MRIKLNAAQLTSSRRPAIYWLHVDLSVILLIKQLKKKVQQVLKEYRDIELCLDNIPFLDEDDIHAINENEEITIKVKEGNNFMDSNYFEAETCSSNYSIVNGASSFDGSHFVTTNFNEFHSSSLIPPKNQQKRVRKRTHKKFKKEVESVKNIDIGSQAVTSICLPKIPSKMHQRFKLDNENNEKESSILKSSDKEEFYVSREVFCNESPLLNSNIVKNTDQSQHKGTASKIPQVPVFVRRNISLDEKSTPNNFITENYNTSAANDINEDCNNMLVVDWKNMSAIKLSSISELQIHNLIQFKTLSMNERGEPEMSSVITARINHICNESSQLIIQILSGIEEFVALNPKFKIDYEENKNEFGVEYEDLFEIFKLS